VSYSDVSDSGSVVASLPEPDMMKEKLRVYTVENNQGTSKSVFLFHQLTKKKFLGHVFKTKF
jgi:hypothetical protein